jgi:hypothetical protein
MKPLRLLRFARLLLGGLFIAALLAGLSRLFHTVVFTHGARTVLQASAVWSALLLASFAGWGSALNTLLFPQTRADFGLRCAWGWGVAVAVGGLLCAVSLATRPVLFVFVAVGLLLLDIELIGACVRWVKRGGLKARRVRLLAADAPFFAGAALVFSLGVVQWLASILDVAFNGNDDNLAYFQFAREILERGTLTQPFSLRHISAYSGKSLLDALVLAIDVPETHLHVLDKGIALLSVLGLIAGHLRTSRKSARSLLLLSMLFTVALPEVRINSSTVMTGVVFFLGLYRTMVWAPVAAARGLRAAVPIALLAAGACTLRQNYLVTVGALLVLAYGRPILLGVRLRPFRVDRAALLDAALTAALLVAFLAPWCVISLRWCGTFLFPVVKGNYNAAYSFFVPLSRLEWYQYIWANVCHDLPIKAVPLFLVAAFAMPDRALRRPLHALLLAAFLGFAMLVYGYPNAGVGDQARYYYGFTFAAILAIALTAADLAARPTAPGRRRADQAVCVTLVIAGLSLQLYEERNATFNTFKGLIDRLDATSPVWVRSKRDPAYVTLQSSVPPNAPIAVMVDNPSHFDHARNRIACLDMVGGVSPPPGIPLAAGGDAVAAYLLGAGYRYLIVVSPDASSSLYRRDTWVKQQKHSLPVWERSAHFYLEAFDDFDDLRKTRVHLAEVGGMTTVDLATRAP